jgi:hypothetical protein
MIFFWTLEAISSLFVDLFWFKDGLQLVLFWLYAPLLAIYMRSFAYLCIFDTTSPWRVEIERHVMEEEPKWLEHDVDELEEEVSEDVPLPGETDLAREDIKSLSQPVP